MTWRDRFDQGPGQDAEYDSRGEGGNVWLERVCDEAGTPMSAITIGARDNGLWRVRSDQHGTQLVVSHAEALSVAQTLTGRSAGRVKTKMRQVSEPTAPIIDTATSAGRLVDAAKADRRRTDASGATHDRRRPRASAADGPKRSFR
jgi:hypothetical protein